MADIVRDELTGAGISVELVSAFAARAVQLLDHPYLVLGSPTYRNGDLPDDLVSFERDMDELDLSGRKAAVFGPGSSRYPYFCEAVEILQARLKICGGRLLLKSLKVDDLSDDTETETRNWARRLASAILRDREGS